MPPLLIGLLGSLGYLGAVIGGGAVDQIEDRLLDASAQVLTPDVVDSLVRPTLADILGSGRLDVVSLGFLLSLWAGSSATATFMNTIVIAYDQRDVRGPIRTRLKALWLFVVGMVLAVLTLPLLVLGPGALVGLLPDGWQATATVLVNAVYWPLVVVGLLLALTSFYNVMLPNRLPWRRHLPGAVFAAAFFLVAALRAAGLRRRHPHHRAALRRAGRADRRPAVRLLLRHGGAAGRRAQRDHPGPLAGAAAPPRPAPPRAAGGQAGVRGPQARA